jgi:hypothetical protein
MRSAPRDQVGELPLPIGALDLVRLHARIRAPQTLGGQHQRRAAQLLMQRFDHLEGQRAALVGLLVEKTQRADLVAVRGEVVGEGLDELARLGFGLRAVAGEGDLVEVDVVDQLLALAAGAFDLVAQLGLVERGAGGGHALVAGRHQFVGRERGLVARDAARLRCC